MRTLALIPARAGSKGIPHKNTRLFRGAPLLTHAVRVGLATCDQTIVSTDDAATALIAAAYGATVLMRPAELAQDETPMLAVLQHALRNVAQQPDVVVLLQPSSPTARRVEHVREALRMMANPDVDSVISLVSIPPHYSPDYAVHLVDGRWVAPMTRLTRRQDARPAYYRDGSVYAIRRWVIQEGDIYGPMALSLIIPPHESVTLDTEDDWLLAEAKHG